MLKHLASLTFGEPGDLAETDISILNKYAIDSKRFVDFKGSYNLLHYIGVLDTRTDRGSKLTKWDHC